MSTKKITMGYHTILKRKNSTPFQNYSSGSRRRVCRIKRKSGTVSYGMVHKIRDQIKAMRESVELSY